MDGCAASVLIAAFWPWRWALAGVTLPASVVQRCSDTPECRSCCQRAVRRRHQLTAAPEPAGASGPRCRRRHHDGGRPGRRRHCPRRARRSPPVRADPATALAAYRKAAATLAVEDPSLPPDLAAAGRHRQGRDRPRPQLGRGEPDHRRPVRSCRRFSARCSTARTARRCCSTPTAAPTTRTVSTTAPSAPCSSSRPPGPSSAATATATASKTRTTSGTPPSPPPATSAAATVTFPSRLICGRRFSPTTPPSPTCRRCSPGRRAYQKAGANLPALDGVPDPLVLGAGGSAGEDPFGDSSAYTAAGVFDDPNAYADAESDDSNAFFDDGSGDPGFIDDGSGTGTDSGTPSPAEPSKPAAKPSAKPSAKPTAKPTVAHGHADRKPAVRVTPTPSTTPKPSSSPKPATTPTPTPTPTSSPTPTPHRPTPTPPPRRPPGRSAFQPGVTATAPAAVTATPVDTDNDGTNDVLRVTVRCHRPGAGKYTLGVRLIDAHGWRVTSAAPPLR